MSIGIAIRQWRWQHGFESPGTAVVHCEDGYLPVGAVGGTEGEEKMRGYLKSGKFGIGLVLFAAIIAVAGGVPAPAQAQSQTSDKMQRLTDELRGIIARGEKQRSADPRFIGELKKLVRKYNWAWRRMVFRERFRDGDYTRDPAWWVGHGEFSVDQQLGLRTRVEPFERQAETRQPEKKSESNDLFGAVLREMTRSNENEANANRQPERRVASTPAEIYTRGSIGNAFALRMRLRTLSSLPARLEFGPYQGETRKEGYRLIYYNRSGARVIELARLRPWGSSVIHTLQKAPALDDGKTHAILWTRDRRGKMVVRIDGKPLIKATDKALSGAFKGITIINGGGDYGIAMVGVTDMPAKP
jgi:hypothetical protein